MRLVRGLSVALGVVAVGAVGIPAFATVASSAPAPYGLTVTPTSALPGATVQVTGTTPTNGENCDSEAVFVTITYFNVTGVQVSKTISLGTADGAGDFTGTITIPSDAAPSSVSGHDAVIVGGCTFATQTTFSSNPVTLVVLGTAPTTTTTTTTVPSTTTTTTAPTTTTTTVPAKTTAPAATPVSATPTFTG
jgi:hypothetical protein